MGTKSLWLRRWQAIVRWWRCEPPSPPANPVLLHDARKMLEEYDYLYGQRTGIHNSQFRSQAAETVLIEGHHRAPGVESEIRVLAILLERVIRHLEEMEWNKP